MGFLILRLRGPSPTLWCSSLYNFLKTHGLTPPPYLIHFLTLVTINSSKLTFSKKNDTPAGICGQIITWKVKNSKMWK